jgi:hypothetical protein
MWQALGDTVVAVVSPALRLLAGVIGDPGELAQPDL